MFDFETIHSLLHWSGARHCEVMPAVKRACWVAADGYGRMTWAELNARTLVGDWSHIRDSSKEALAIIWEILQNDGLVSSKDIVDSMINSECLAFVEV